MTADARSGTIRRVSIAVTIVAAGILLLILSWPQDPGSGPPAPGTAGPEAPPVEVPDAADGIEPAPGGGEVDPPEDLPGVPIEGRVVDSRRFPVAGARVTAEGFRGRAVETTSGAGGRFRFGRVPVPDEPWRIPLFAVGPAGRVGRGLALHRSKVRLHEPVIVLSEAHRLEVLVTADDRPVRGAEVRIEDLTPRPVTDDGGRAAFAAIPAGHYTVVARAADGRLGCSFGLVPPAAPGPVAIRLLPVWEVRVRVVRKGTGEPVVGATLELTRNVRSGRVVRVVPYTPAPPPPPTDEDGWTVVGLFPGDRHSVKAVHLPGVPPRAQPWDRRLAYIKPGDEELTVELPGTRTLRVPVADGEAPVPADGTEIRLELHPTASARPPPPAGRMVGAELVIEASAETYFHAVGRAPDGAVAVVYATREGVPRTTSFSPPRTVTVTLRAEEGRLVPGVAVELRNQGNNPVAPVVVTGEDGLARFTGLYGRLLDVHVLVRPESLFWGTQVGTIDLAEGDAAIEATVGREREIVLRFTVDGETRLPSILYLPPGAVEDPEKGEVRYRERIAPGMEKHRYRFVSPSHPHAGSIVDVPPSGPIVHRFDLRPSGNLVARISPPPDGHYRLKLERMHGAGIPSLFGFDDLKAGRGGVVRAGPLPPGSYRIVETRTHLASDFIEVAAGTTRELTFDLSRAGVVQGRVEVPEGVDYRLVCVFVTGRGILPQKLVGPERSAVAVRENGWFLVRVPGDREVELVPWHPSLTPAPDGSVRLTSPQDSVVLKLVRGAMCRFRPVPFPRIEPDIPPRALLFREGDESPAFTLPVHFSHRGATFGGYEPGTYRLWLDLFGFRPVVFDKVTLGDQETDLGIFALEPGSSIRLRVFVPQGESPPRISLWANRLDSPSYTRGTNSGGQEEVVVKGLGPGRFRVTGGPIGGSRQRGRIDETVKVDGENDVTLTLDLRK